jgi:hypothetical protein
MICLTNSNGIKLFVLHKKFCYPTLIFMSGLADSLAKIYWSNFQMEIRHVISRTSPPQRTCRSYGNLKLHIFIKMGKGSQTIKAINFGRQRICSLRTVPSSVNNLLTNDEQHKTANDSMFL